MRSSSSTQHHSTASSISQVKELSKRLVEGKEHPSQVSLQRHNKNWTLSKTRYGSDYRSWKKISQTAGKKLAEGFFRKNGVGKGLVPLSEGTLTNFTVNGLKHYQQSAPKVGETLRLGISQTGQVVLAIPNLEEGSVLEQAGITADDMENLTTTAAVAASNHKKEQALSRYWDEIATVADNVELFDSTEIRLQRSSDGTGRPKSPHFNLALQTHLPQHLRFNLATKESFGASNPFFDHASGKQTELLNDTANVLNDRLFSAPTHPSSPTTLPPLSPDEGMRARQRLFTESFNSSFIGYHTDDDSLGESDTALSDTALAEDLKGLTKAYSNYIADSLAGGKTKVRDKKPTVTDATTRQLLNLLDKLDEDFNDYQDALTGLDDKNKTREERKTFKQTKHRLENSVGNNVSTNQLGFSRRKGRQEILTALNLINGSIGEELKRRIEKESQGSADRPSDVPREALNQLIAAWNKYIDLAETFQKPEFNMKKNKKKQFDAAIAKLPDSSHLRRLESIQWQTINTETETPNRGLLANLGSALMDFFSGILYPFSDEEASLEDQGSHSDHLSERDKASSVSSRSLQSGRS